MAIGWCLDLTTAEDYFADERPDVECWDALDSAMKTPLLMRAYNRLYYSKEFILPKYVEADSDDLEVLVKAQCEMAYYLCLHGEDEDLRKGIQAQAVIEAGVVKEKYKEAALYDTPIPQFVRDLLCQYLAGDEGTHFGAVDLARDEDESVNTKVHNF
jgi:hypothetical protein